VGADGCVDHDPAVIFAERQPEQLFARCVECRRVSGPFWIHWRAVRIEEPGADDAPEIALYCPSCAEREFGAPRRRPLADRRRRHR
jgi:hypothetical protein